MSDSELMKPDEEPGNYILLKLLIEVVILPTKGKQKSYWPHVTVCSFPIYVNFHEMILINFISQFYEIQEDIEQIAHHNLGNLFQNRKAEAVFCIENNSFNSFAS